MKKSTATMTITRDHMILVELTLEEANDLLWEVVNLKSDAFMKWKLDNDERAGLKFKHLEELHRRINKPILPYYEAGVLEALGLE